MSVTLGLTDEENREVDRVMNIPDEVYARDARIGQLERLCEVLANRIDELEAENGRLKEHIRNFKAEAIA